MPQTLWSAVFLHNFSEAYLCIFYTRIASCTLQKNSLSFEIERRDGEIGSLAIVMLQRRIMRQEGISENTLQKHFRAIVADESFLNEISNWLDVWGDKRLLILRHLVYEIDLSETEQLKEALYEYGSCLTEKNYCGRKLFSMMATLIRQIEMGGCMEKQG